MITETVKVKKSPSKLSPEKKSALAAELRAQLAAVMQQDPFWYFIPNDGVLNEARRAFLRRYLKEEDIPERVDSQLDALLLKSDIKGISGGNRSAKSETITIAGLIRATGELPESLEPYRESHFKEIIERAHSKVVMGRMTAVDAKQLERVVLPKWKRWVPREYLKNGSWEDSYSKQYDILRLYRKGKECSVTEFLTNSQDVRSSQGGDLDWAGFDEEPDRDKWKETLMRFGTAAKLDISIAWTPTEGLTWATDIFHAELENEELGNEDRTLLKLCSVCNPYVQLETLQKGMDEYAKVSSYDEMKMRLLGEAISLSGLVYGNLFRDKDHVIAPFFDDLDPSKKKEFLCLTGWDMHLVTPSAGVFCLLDREGNKYVDRCFFEERDTNELKTDFHRIVKDNGYRLGWSVVDKSSNSSIIAFGGRNIYKEVSTGKNAIPGLRCSEKYEGSIRAGVDEIKQDLKPHPISKRPRLFIVNRPENKLLIKSMKTLERDTYANEEEKGPKDRIKEGKHHLHAALRYLYQYPMNWYEEQLRAPDPVFQDAEACF